MFWIKTPVRVETNTAKDGQTSCESYPGYVAINMRAKVQRSPSKYPAVMLRDVDETTVPRPKCPVVSHSGVMCSSTSGVKVR